MKHAALAIGAIIGGLFLYSRSQGASAGAVASGGFAGMTGGPGGASATANTVYHDAPLQQAVVAAAAPAPAQTFTAPADGSFTGVYQTQDSYDRSQDHSGDTWIPAGVDQFGNAIAGTWTANPIYIANPSAYYQSGM